MSLWLAGPACGQGRVQAMGLAAVNSEATWPVQFPWLQVQLLEKALAHQALCVTPAYRTQCWQRAVGYIKGARLDLTLYPDRDLQGTLLIVHSRKTKSSIVTMVQFVVKSNT